MSRGHTEPDFSFKVSRTIFSILTAVYPPNRFAWISIALVKIRIHVRFPFQAVSLFNSVTFVVILLPTKVYIAVLVMCAVYFNTDVLICCAQFHVEEPLIMASRPQRARHRPQRDALPWTLLRPTLLFEPDTSAESKDEIPVRRQPVKRLKGTSTKT